ncbi:PspC domain-containing protein [Allofustis seminis]|uniref:PspC domain-containing protein n=1 Tax=Allofustis seminis TaxID=166939 RepID=UPI0003810D80|nr:PspC domain-containing protein [Allofustis seminis]
MPKKRLTKSRTDKIIMGVLGGIANYFNIDPIIVRIIFILLFMIFEENMIFLYLVGILIMPKERKNKEQRIYVDVKRSPKPSVEESSSKITEEDWSDF